jgi:Asp-tRNA(Asn)/Glu-tRNA(Gln) amidotransferase A subunit family amidase
VQGPGAATIPLQLPDLPYDALRHILFAGAAAAFEELTLENTDDKLTRRDPGAWPNSFRKARFLSAVDHIQLDRLRRRLMQEMDTIFRKVDVILAPTISGKMTLIGNMTGHPSLTIRTRFTEQRTREMPTYLDAETKKKKNPAHTVPHGTTIVAPLFDEAAAVCGATGCLSPHRQSSARERKRRKAKQAADRTWKKLNMASAELLLPDRATPY